MRAVVLLALLVACQGSGGTDKPPPKPPADAAPVEDALDLVFEDAPRVEPEPEPPDPGKLIAELGAMPAWQAVIDRAQLLARRGQRGVVYGKIGPAIMQLGEPPERVGSAKPIDAGLEASPYVWLVDDTEGNGALGIRVLLAKEPAKEGDRVALGGAWFLDDKKRWYWKVDSVTTLPAAPPGDIKDPPAPFPSHEIQTGNYPAGVRTITLAKDNDAVYFQIVGPPPVRDGDGWLVANELGDTPFARLTLPGERAAYGGQDMRAANERWVLKRVQTYWVRIGKIRKHAKPDEPVSINARTAPVRIN
ncbi:MAG: hypothetical protein M4D80_25035 [Myxococcota bacterium]|nr:hypothetical protein [Deltaproteobacteria bacterium]MDQ3338445.1 hypothetical protein [Myxococcota bacterium]